MNPTVHSEPRPEAMADVPGVCELPLTRAIVHYRDVHEIEMAGGRIQDIGIALVLEGRYASSAEALDLGSTDVKILDLSAQLVVLDWAHEPTLEHALSLLSASRQQPERQRDLERFAFRLGLGLLERVGFGPLTRPTFLRVGFRDICRDLDLHEGTSVRVIMGPGRVVRAHLDYDGNALIFRTATTERDGALEEALELAFAKGELRRLVPPSSLASGGYQVRLPLPLSFAELRQELRRIRFGLDSLSPASSRRGIRTSRGSSVPLGGGKRSLDYAWKTPTRVWRWIGTPPLVTRKRAPTRMPPGHPPETCSDRGTSTDAPTVRSHPPMDRDELTHARAPSVRSRAFSMGPWALRPEALRSRYLAYRRQQVRQLLSLMPREAIRPLYRSAIEESMPSSSVCDPLGVLMDYLDSRMPLPPFGLWCVDVRRSPEEHLDEGWMEGAGPHRGAPMMVACRSESLLGQPWTAHLRCFRESCVWYGYLSFQHAGHGATYRTTDIFREGELRSVRGRFMDFDPLTLEAFLRSVLP